ncbi:hypothetical protein JWG39_14845 [Desulforhopalus vacuolatus]|uniref:hypothetical protein n=1 Tax=Desulforhopalus vacuolatus TaxID=40414 RepID=UPI001963AFEE|nr:hypothetical protein [Desulforhopalus vacuolatus]MBM9521097.1 hypothetical protein [Desulforhopalus vacuolatus]
MKIFSKKEADDNDVEEDKRIESSEEEVEVNIKPRICCLDIVDDTITSLKNARFNVYSGTLGNKIKVPNTGRTKNHQVLLNYDFPPNLHEYDIIILDLENYKVDEYSAENHVRKNHTGKNALSLLSSYPETVFDPRPLCSQILGGHIKKIGNRPYILIVFTTSSYTVEYETILLSEYDTRRQGTEEHNIYSFSENAYLANSKYGTEMSACEIREDLRNLINAHIDETVYNQTFHHPHIWGDSKSKPNPDFVPLIKNASDDIVSYCMFINKSVSFYFPQIKRKAEFLNTFLLNIAPEITPDIFPFSSTFNWKNNKEYWLPKHETLLFEKKEIENEFKIRIDNKEVEISENLSKYSFLHSIITETGDDLVEALIEFLEWLGFENVLNCDKKYADSDILEEDIQIELYNGLLIVECKGIGGTSTDANCSQISKIKHRRCKERNKFDVYALYIVNHQRYLPPSTRQNPPFTDNQIQDAINDERGLLSTWQLFDLYFDIENAIIDKKQARENILEFGIVDFSPRDLVFIDEPKELFHNGEICIVNISDTNLTVGEEIYVQKNGKFSKNTIEDIQKDNVSTKTVSEGEIGLKFAQPIKKNSTLWKKIKNT